MNTTPAYRVRFESETITLTQSLFMHERLLTACKQAMSHAEQLLLQLWQRNDTQCRLTVHLVETSSQIATPVAQVYRLMLPITPPADYPQARALLFERLNHLHEEFSYYQTNGHSMGLGCFRTEIEEDSARHLFCHLYEATGYFNELIGECNRFRPDEQLLLALSTYDDCHYLAAPMTK